MKLTGEQVEQYRTEGYVVVEGVLDERALREAQTACDAFVEESRARTASDDRLDLDPAHTAERPRLRRVKQPHLFHPLFTALKEDAAVLDAVEALVGPDIRFMDSKLNMKLPEVGEPIEWHQDFGFFPHTNDDLVACGVALDDSTTENGCLLVLPGSHRGPTLDHHDPEGRFVGAVDPSAIDMSAVVPVPVPAGGMSLHHVRLLHASEPNRSQRARRMCFFQYAATDAFPLTYTPILLEPGFESLERAVVRGRQGRVARLQALETIMPRFDEPYSSIYHLQERSPWSAFTKS